jgi:hypothetical protein
MLDWHEKAEKMLQDLLSDLDNIHPAISAINMLAETLLSLGTPVPDERVLDFMGKDGAANRMRDVNRMINVPRGLVHIDQTVLLPFAERVREVYRTLHEQTLPGLRQLNHLVDEMLAHPIPLVAAVGRTGKLVVVGCPPVDQVWVTPMTGVDGQLRRRVYFLPPVSHAIRLFRDLEHELFMINRNITPMLDEVRTQSKKEEKNTTHSLLLLPSLLRFLPSLPRPLLLLLLLILCRVGKHRQDATR